MTGNTPELPQIVLLGADFEAVSERDECVGRDEVVVRRGGEVELDVLARLHGGGVHQSGAGREEDREGDAEEVGRACVGRMGRVRRSQRQYRR